MEWKKFCALDLCSEEAQNRLREFAFLRFRNLASRYAHRTSVKDTRSLAPEKKDSWHLFETHMTVKTTQQGKRYKDWLFARTIRSDDPALDVIQGGASLIMRQVVRDFLRQEFPPKNIVSLHSPLSNNIGGSFTLEDLLPVDIDPSSEAALREYEKLAEVHADNFFENMTRRERLALLAREIGISLTHKTIEKIAGCRKSMLNAAYQDFMRRIAARLRTEYRDDDNESVLQLALMTVGNVKKSVLDWGKSENACAELFRTVEGGGRAALTGLK